MFPKHLKRVRVFDPEKPLIANRIGAGVYEIEGSYGVRPLDQYFDLVDLYIPRDWGSEVEGSSNRRGNERDEG